GHRDVCRNRPLQLEARQAGHVVIEDDADGLVVRVETEQFCCGVERGDRESGRGEQAPERQSHPFVVVHHENATWQISHSSEASVSTSQRRVQLSLINSAQWPSRPAASSATTRSSWRRCCCRWS